MATNSMNLTVRRLTAAEGYLDLDLPKLALEELDRVEEPGPLGVPYLWLKAAALRADDRFEEAADLLRQLAPSLPASLSEKTQQLMTECIEQVSQSASQTDIAPASVETNPAAHSRTLQINIPHVGQFSLTVVGSQSLTISIKRPPASEEPTKEAP